MRLNLIRQILTSFLLVCAGFAVAWGVSLYLLQAAIGRMDQLAALPGGAAAEALAVRQSLRNGEVVVLLVGLAGLVGGLVGMVLAASQASRMLARLKQATQQLANVVLDELDWELQRRGHRFARYADDCNIVVGSQRAGERVMQSVARFVQDPLRLTVNARKSAVDRPWEHKFPGFTVSRAGVKLKVSDKAIEQLMAGCGN